MSEYQYYGWQLMDGHPFMSMVEDYKHRNNPPLPPMPCQICGKPRHKERYCPNTKALGYFDD